MTASQIENTIESETLDIHSSAYSSARQALAETLTEELENGDVAEYARNYLAAARRAMLHELQAIGAPDEIIESVFSAALITRAWPELTPEELATTSPIGA